MGVFVQEREEEGEEEEVEGRQLDRLNVSVPAPSTSPVILVPMRFTAERERGGFAKLKIIGSLWD